MNCIFCNAVIDCNTTPAEHIIPNNIGGTVVTYDVCKKCNHALSATDVELHKQRHIYDSYKNIENTHDLKLVFRFIESYAENTDGSIVKLVPKSTSNKIIRSKISENVIVSDCSITDKEDEYLNIVKNIKNKYQLSDSFISKHLERYYKFIHDSIPGSIYRDNFLTRNIEIRINLTNATKQTVMNAKTPHRFIAKACVEYASLFGFSDQILNIDILKKHALLGGFEETHLKFFENMPLDNIGRPYHIISFTNNQFSVTFFGKYGVAVNINWKNEPIVKRIANDLIHKRLFECFYENGCIEISKKEIVFKRHNESRRTTHKRRKIY